MRELLFVIDDKIPYIKGVAEQWGRAVYLPPDAIVRDAVRDADALIVRTRTVCDAELLAGSRVRFIGTATIGFDHIDRSYCGQAGIGWANAPGCNADSVVQYVLSLLALQEVRTGVPMARRTVGIVGVGAVGSRVERACRILGLRVLRNDPPREAAEGAGDFVPLSRLLTESDVVTLHTPLTREGEFPTIRLLDAERLGWLKPDALLINAARGAVVDNAALLPLLESGRLTAALDCWEEEPQVNRRLQAALWLGTPHIAGYSADGKRNGSRMAMERAAAFLGLPAPDFSRIAVPGPVCPEIVFGESESESERVRRALLATYDPRSDDAALRADPSGFERLRGSYGLRRECGAYRLSARDGRIPEVLSQLGFGV